MKKKGSLLYKFIYKYEVDFWGYLTSCLNRKRFFKKMFKIFSFRFRHRVRLLRYLYRKIYFKFQYPRIIKKKRKIKPYKQEYILRLHNLLKFRVYYGDMTIKKLRKYLQRVNTRRLDFESKICFLLESRLDILLFRLNLVKTPREAREFIKCKKVKINYQIVTRANYQLYINDIISFEKEFAKILFNNLEKKVCKNRRKIKILFNYPKYLEMNYNLMKCIFISYPKKIKDIPFTWKVNLSYLRNFI